ncbi:MAG: zeta toxin family protein [Bacteroidetes bacterium]|nr:zeta toxin family protein [Bacteroidota bacterium]MBS1592509.1 zeta toxin family protein [Bacteroidota bacterium]
MPTLYVITGPNGAGKSSIGASLLPDSIRSNYMPYDADKLKMIEQVRLKKQGLTYKEAGQLADEFVFKEFDRRYKDALNRNDHFVYEGHFSEETSWNLIKEFKEAGYKIDMIFIGLATLKLSQDRVHYRAINGGHNVNAYDIQNNYFGNLETLNKHFSLIDNLSLIDNSKNIPIYIAQVNVAKVKLFVKANLLPAWVVKYLPDVLK